MSLYDFERVFNEECSDMKHGREEKLTLNEFTEKALNKLGVKFFDASTSSQGEHVNFRIGDGYGTISSFTNACGAVILSGFYGRCKETLNKVLATALILTQNMNYSSILYSATPEQQIVPLLLENGFKLLEGSSVVNSRTGNTINLYQFQNKGEQDD